MRRAQPFLCRMRFSPFREMFVDGKSLRLTRNGCPAKRKAVYENAVEAATRNCKPVIQGLSHHELKEMIREGKTPPSKKMAGGSGGGIGAALSQMMHLKQRRSAACYYCGSTLYAGSTMEKDHVVPKAHGGPDTDSNIVDSCRSCNQSKGARPVEAFRESIENWNGVESLVRFFGELPEVRRALKLTTQTWRAVHPKLQRLEDRPSECLSP